MVVLSVDHFSRKLVHMLLIEEELRKAGVIIHFVQGDYDDTPEGQAFKQMRGVFAELERSKIAERMARGRRSKARQGLAVGTGRIAYGYRYDDSNHLVIEEKEAQVVRWIFELYTDSQETSIRGIARRLTSSPYRTYEGNKEWQACTVAQILSSETYAGTAYYNKMKYENEYSQKKVRRSKEEWIPIPVPAIVTRGTFEAAQRRLAHNRKMMRKRPRHPYLLRGMLVCAECGYAYGGMFSKGKRYYADCSRGGNKTHPAPALRADVVEEKIWEAVKEMLLNPSTYATCVLTIGLINVIILTR